MVETDQTLEFSPKFSKLRFENSDKIAYIIFPFAFKGWYDLFDVSIAIYAFLSLLLK